MTISKIVQYCFGFDLGRQENTNNCFTILIISETYCCIYYRIEFVELCLEETDFAGPLYPEFCAFLGMEGFEEQGIDLYVRTVVNFRVVQ